MANYRVKTIAVAVKNNRIAKFGEMVHDSELTSNASEMISGGYIEILDADDMDVVAEEVLKSDVKAVTEDVISKAEKVLEKDDIPAKDKVKDSLTNKK